MLKVIFQKAPARVYTRNFEVKKCENLYAKYCDLSNCNTTGCYLQDMLM